MEPADSVDEDIDVAMSFPRIGDYPRNTSFIRRIRCYKAQSIAAIAVKEQTNGRLPLVIHARTDTHDQSASRDEHTNECLAKSTSGACNQRHTAREIICGHQRTPLAAVGVVVVAFLVQSA
jgi:hypothetical protein